MALLMDTPYLEQLKLSSARLQDMIPSTNPFAMYTRGSETAPPMIQGVPQNFFDPVTGQFMMPNLQLRSGEEIPVIGSTMGSTPNFGTYTPAAFGEAYQEANPVTSEPSLLDTELREGRRRQDVDANTRALESLGGMNLQINPVTGRIEVLDPNSLTSKLLSGVQGIQKFTPAGMISNLTGGSSYGNQLDRIRNQYGDSVANEIAASVQESYRTGVAPTGLLSGGLPAGTRIDEGPLDVDL